MRKLLFSLLTVCAVFSLTSCLDNTQEITIAADGSGKLVTTNDMSSIISMVKSMGGAGDLEKIADAKLDSTFSIADAVTKIDGLTEREKAMAAKGSMHLQIDMTADQFKTTIAFPFKNTSEIAEFNSLTTKVMASSMKDKMGEMGKSPAGDDMPAPSGIDDYYTQTFSAGKIVKKFNAEKYKTLDSDEFLKGLQEASQMGMELKNTYIFNLPKPATKVTGKNIKLSDDKMKVTVNASSNDFFETPADLEYTIEY